MIKNDQSIGNANLVLFWRHFVFVCCLVSFSTLLIGQNVSGVVLGQESNEPLIGAAVLERGTSNGTITDFDGSFSLDIQSFPAVLEISYIGYSNKEVEVATATSSMTISLMEGALLDEVVVTALGIERKAKNLTYAVQKLDGSELTEVRDANFVNTLNGKVAGVVVTQGAGGPGGASRVVLRGNTSISGNNNALFVVDGVPIDNSNRGQVANDFGGYNYADGASNINPFDIDNVSILKGAAAAALYGSRAQNGVVLVTTKKGESGKVKVNFNAGLVTENPMILPEVQNTFGQGNGGTSNTTSNGSWGGRTTTYPSNIEDFFRTGLSSNVGFGLSGGSEKTQAYFSYTNDRTQGIVDRNELDRHTFNLRLNHQLGERIFIDAKATYVSQQIDNRVKTGEENGTAINLYKIPRSVDLASMETLTNPDGTLNYWTSSSINQNPYWLVNNTSNFERRNRVMFLGSATYKLLDNLNFMARASIDRYNDRESFSFSDGTLILANQGGSYSEGSGETQELNFDLLLTGNSNLNSNLRLDYNVGAALNRRENNYSISNASGLLVPNQFFLQFGRALSAETVISERETQSVYATASLAYNDYLILDLTARNDWSSTLPAPHSFFYPSIGLTGIISEMANLPDYVTFLKLRGSWTRVGNDAPPYQLAQTFVLGQGGRNGLIQRSSQRLLPNLEPEETTSLEFGLDLRLFRNKLGFDLTWYKTNTVNQLLEISLPAPTGFETQLVNAGDVQNNGVELSVNYRVKDAGDFRYETTMNFARNVNEIIELVDGQDRVLLGGRFGRTADPSVVKGGAYGDLYGEGWMRDGQGRFVVDANGLPVGSGAGEILVGNFNPDFTLGWNHKFSYKNLSFGFLLDGRFGGEMVSGTEANLAFDGNADYTTAFREGGLVLNGVTEDGTANTTAINAEQLWTRVSQGRYSWGEFFTYDATNIRLRELTVGYNFDLGENSPFRFIRVSLAGRNLFFLYRGKAILDIPGMPERRMNFDPDINLGAGNFQGVEYGNLPSTRSFGINLSVGI